MATDNIARYGFRPFLLNGGNQAPSPETCFVATGYQATTADLHIGDPVLRVSDGSVAISTAGTALYGIIVGVLPHWNGTLMTPSDRLPGGTSWGTVYERQSRVLVQPLLPGDVWEVDADDNVTAVLRATYESYIGENADHSFSIDATAKRSYPRLDISRHTTATEQWRIVGISPSLDNADFAGNYVKLLVTANEVATMQTWGGATGV